MAGESSSGTIVLYCSPNRSHMVPIMEFAKLLLTHHPDFSVTVILAAPDYTPPTAEAFISTSIVALPSVHFLRLPAMTIPDDFPPHNSPAPNFELARLNGPGLRHALQTQTPNVKVFILDFFCNPAFLICRELDIPTYYLFVSGAIAFTAFMCLSRIHDTVEESVEELDVYYDIPGVPQVHTRDLPSHARDRTSRAYPHFVDSSRNMIKGAGVIVNTFESLEPITIKAIREGNCVADGHTPALYCIGPLFNSGDGGGKAADRDRVRHHSLIWLDSQPGRSVLFLSFGSAGFAFSAEQILEIGVGLERSGVGFLWVARSPPGSTSALQSFLPEGFLERTKARGLLVDSWAPQVEILGHGSVGGFVTHCGWNSILEAIAAGVPMRAWPLYAEQRINLVVLVEEMGAALAVAQSGDGLVSAAEVEKRALELLRSDRGKGIRERAMRLRDEAAAAVEEGGSSLAALAELIESMKGSD